LRTSPWQPPYATRGGRSDRLRLATGLNGSRAVALAMVHGPKAGLALVGTLDANERMAHTHRLEAVRAHLLELAGDGRGARILPVGGEDDLELARAALPGPARGPSPPPRAAYQTGGLTRGRALSW
jgi:hypothetical protein